MKKINWILVATFSLLAMALVSCNKDITLQEIEQESAGTISVSVDGIMGEYAQGNETKAGLVSTTRVSWSAGDKVYVYDRASCLGELTVSLKDGKDYYAVLTGESITAPQEGTTKLTLVYCNATVSEISDGKVTVEIAAQAGSTTPANIPFVAFGTLDYTSGTPEISGQIADFSLATSLMRLNCAGLEANAAITGATLTGMSNECVLNITKGGVEIGQGNMGDIAVSFTGVSANANGAQTLYAAVAKNGTASAQELEIKQTKTYTYSFGSKAREAGKAFNAICPMVWKRTPATDALPGEFSVSDTKTVHFSKGNLYAKKGSDEKWTLGFYNQQYEYNSLNVNCDEDGSREVYSTDTEIDLFTWGYGEWSFIPNGEDYQEGDFTDWGSQIGDGTSWRTLSETEWEYLINNHDCSYGVTVCGRTNCVVIAPDNFTGKIVSSYDEESWSDAAEAGLVCLPAAGYRQTGSISSSVYGVNDSGYYWASTDYERIGERRLACCVNVSQYEIPYITSLDCDDAISVRLVTEVVAE